MKSSIPSPRRGFMLLEVVLALTIFGIAATGFAVAMKKTADAALMAQRRMQITRVLQSAMDEAISIPMLEEGTTTVDVVESGMKIDTKIEKIEDLQNQDGQQLQDLYRIVVTARWLENGVPMDSSAETWRNSRMYQP